MINKIDLTSQKIFFVIQKSSIYRHIKTIINLFFKKGYSFYFVGGALRDVVIHLLYNKEFAPKDIDIVVETKNYELLLKDLMSLNLFKDAILKKFPQFLTMSFTIKDLRVDISLPRKEYYLHPGALPKVEIGNIIEDLYRRDFTINAFSLKYDIEKKDFFIFDPYNGISDLLKKKIRILHEKSFIDDPTRIIRALRFKSQLCFDIEKHTFFCLKEALSKDVLYNISQVRLSNEFLQILKKLENLEKVAEDFKRFNIIKYYSFIKEIVENFIDYAKNLELKKISSQERYFIRIFFLLEKTLGDIEIFDKEKFVKFKEYMIKLNIPHKEREIIYQAYKIFSLEYKLKKIPLWLKKYSILFNRRIPKEIISNKKLLAWGVPQNKLNEIIFLIKKDGIKKITKDKVKYLLANLNKK